MNILQMSVQAGSLVAAIAVLRAAALYRLPKTGFLALWGVVLARMLIPFSVSSGLSIYGLFRGLPAAASTGGPIPPGVRTGPLFAALWLGGAAVLAVIFAGLLANSCRVIRYAVPVRDSNLITQWSSERKLYRPLRILHSDRITSPLSAGILRPCIVFPAGMDLDDERLVRYILAHEYIHIRRFDMLWKLLALCAVCVHWFNPLAWVMLALLNRDLELSCDEMVLRQFGGEARAAYAHSLISMAEYGGSGSILHNYFGRNATEERIISIMKYKKASVLGVVLAAALVIVGASAFATRPQSPTHEHETPGILVSVNKNDEDRYTPEQWSDIMEKVEAGEILFFDTLEDEIAYHHNANAE